MLIKIPAKIDSKISEEIRGLQEKTIQIIYVTPEKEWVTKQHHGMGLFIRNNWGFWKKEGPYYNFFKKLKITHPDDMSSIILTIIHRRVKELPDNIDELVDYYIKFWEQKNGSN